MLISKIYNSSKSFINTGHQRSIRAKKNIIASLLLKGFGVLVTFLLVPLTLNYLDTVQYGIYLTIISFVGWFSFFDIGFGNGLRNKLTEALALKDYELAKIYVSTTYAVLTLVIAVVTLVIFAVNPFLNWSKILNASQELSGELSKIVMLVFLFFAFRFVLQLIGVIFMADQNPALNNALNPIENLLSLILIYFVTRFSHGSLFLICLIVSASPVVILILFSIYFFHGRYSFLRPAFSFVNFKYLKPLMSLGVKFFILQVAGIIIFATSNIVITQILGPAEVTPFNIAFKYFGIPLMLFSIITTPLWSAFTDAFVKNDMEWIKAILKKTIQIWILISIGTFIFLLVANPFYRLWVGSDVKISFLLSFFMALYVLIITGGNIFTSFINGVGKIKLQVYAAVVEMIINIPLSIFFAKTLNMSTPGVILGTCLTILVGSILIAVQSFKIIKGQAKGIWNK
jgi:O-antigen/teichoic acid export membrane protein